MSLNKSDRDDIRLGDQMDVTTGTFDDVSSI